MIKKIAISTTIVSMGLVWWTVLSKDNMPTKPQAKEEITVVNENKEPPVHIKKEEKKNTAVQHTYKKTQSKFKSRKEKIEALIHCEEQNNCPVDNRDPRASDFLKEKLIVIEAGKIIGLQKRGLIEDSEAEELSLKLLEYPGGAVQSKALELISELEPSQKIKSGITHMLQESHDEKCTSQALKELSRYDNISEEVTDLFIETIAHGSFLVGRKISEEILPFLNENNIDQYKNLLKELPKDSKKAKSLESNIREFELLRSNG